MSNAELITLLTPLYDGPRPLHEVLGTTNAARLKEARDYLHGNFAYVSVRDGVLVAELLVVGKLFVEKARKRLAK
jgi:hypothetical protein